MIKNLIFTFVAYLALGVSISSAQEGTMLNDLDLPLPAGLSENNEGAMLFDSPDGRIINAEAAGIIEGSRVFEYYKVVLPSLGWKLAKDHTSGLVCDVGVKYCLRALREKEDLLLSIHENGDRSKINYALSPN